MTKADLKERDELQVEIQRSFCFMAARRFLEDPTRAKEFIDDTVPQKKRYSKQRRVYKRLLKFIEQTA